MPDDVFMRRLLVYVCCRLKNLVIDRQRQARGFQLLVYAGDFSQSIYVIEGSPGIHFTGAPRRIVAPVAIGLGNA